MAHSYLIRGRTHIYTVLHTSLHILLFRPLFTHMPLHTPARPHNVIGLIDHPRTHHRPGSCTALVHGGACIHNYIYLAIRLYNYVYHVSRMFHVLMLPMHVHLHASCSTKTSEQHKLLGTVQSYNITHHIIMLQFLMKLYYY